MLQLMGLMVAVLLVGPLVLIATAGLLLVVAALLPRSPRRVRETFPCPVTGRVVTADFVVADGAAHPSEVAWCTAFPNPERVTCKKLCRDFAEAHWGLSRGVFPRWALTGDGTVTWRNVEGSPAEQQAA